MKNLVIWAAKSLDDASPWSKRVISKNPGAINFVYEENKKDNPRKILSTTIKFFILNSKILKISFLI